LPRSWWDNDQPPPVIDFFEADPMDDKMQLMMFGVRNVTRGDKRRWREMLERLGPEGARSRLSRMTSVDPDEMVEIDESGEGLTRKFVEDWLADMSIRARRRDTRRFWIMVVLGTVAAVASCIAA
jgi:hypothetical protein